MTPSKADILKTLDEYVDITACPKNRDHRLKLDHEVFLFLRKYVDVNLLLP